MDALSQFLLNISSFIWGVPMIVMLGGVGIYLTVILKGMQFWALPHAFKLILTNEPRAMGDISNFQALMVALAATVGIGNIVGVATAITFGGPGAIFWMWMIGLISIATKYSEALLAVKYRESSPTGFRGGPMYYLRDGLNMPRLAIAFAFFTILASFGIGNMTQANAVASIIYEQISIPHWISGLVMLVATGAVILGGVKSLGKFASFLTPFMIILYLGGAFVIILLNLDKVGGAFSLIFYHAFNPISASGGFLGATIAAAIRYGVARGVFANESGMGSAPIIAAAAKTNDPVKQALISMTQTFIDTLVVCTATALVILICPFWQDGVSAGVLTLKSFELHLGAIGTSIVVISTSLFAYSAILGWSYYGERAMEYIFGEGFNMPYRLFFIMLVGVGAIIELEIVWSFSDIANGLMAVPNVIALFLLSKIIQKESNRYFSELKKG